MSDPDTPRRLRYSEQVGKRNGIWLDAYCTRRLFRATNVFRVMPRVLRCLFLLTPCALWLLQPITLTDCLQDTAANFSLLAQEPQIRPGSISIVGIRSLIPYEPKLAFYGDSRLLVANGLGLEVWDIGQKSLVTTLGGHSYPIDGLALSEREGLVVTAATREIIVRNAISGNVCAMFGWPYDDEHPRVNTVAIVGDGDEIVSAGLQGVFATDIKRGKRRVLWQDIASPIIATDASGRLLLVGNTRLQTAALYDMRTKEWQRFIVNVKWFPESTISSTGRFVVVHGSDDCVQVRDIHTGVVVRSFVGTTFGFSPNGKDVTVMAEQPAHANEAKVYTVALWDIESGDKTAQVGPFPYPVIAAAFIQSGKLLATCDLDEICVWEIPSGRKMFRANLVNVADIRDLGLGKQSNKLVVALSDLPIKGVYGFVEWDLSEGRPTRKNLLAERSRVLGGSVCDDGTTIVLLAYGQNAVIRIHDLWREAELLVIREPLPATVSCCAVSADGSTVASWGSAWICAFVESTKKRVCWKD